MKRGRDGSSDSEDGDEKLHCPKCAKTFKTHKYLQQHMQIHRAKHSCDICGKTYSFLSNLTTHKKNVHGIHPTRKNSTVLYSCNICGKSFGKKCNLVRHKGSIHQMMTPKNVDTSYPCRHCDMIFQSYRDLIDHVEANHPLIQQGGHQQIPHKTLEDGRQTNMTENDTDIHSKRDNAVHSAPIMQNEPRHEEHAHTHNDESALRKNVQNRYIFPRKNERYDTLTFFANIRQEVMSFLMSQLRRLGGIKWNLCVQVELERDDGSETRMSSPYFRSRTYISLSLEDMNEHDLNEAFQKMYASLEKYMRDGSGWFIREVLKLEIHTVIYRPLSGSSYIKLPTTLAHSNSVINIQNEDDKCFLYSVLASLHPAQQYQEDVRQYAQYEHELDMTGIHYPVKLPQIHRFEQQNENISVNVFTFENKCILPLRVTGHTHRLHHVNLLWLKTSETAHYCLISDLNRFLSRTKKCKNKQFFCPYCLHAFIREELLIDHQPNCSVHGPQKIELPSEDDAVLKFREFEKTLMVPFVIYADFETVNKKIHTCAPNPEHAASTPTTKLEVCSFGYKRICENNQFTKPTVTYRGPDAAKRLVESLLKEQDEINQILSNIKPMALGPEHDRFVEKSTHCCLCQTAFTDHDKVNKRIVIHHNHLTGDIIGAACNACNLRCKQAKYTCVIFHNLKNFDAHILCETLGQFKEHRLTCIAQNIERYVSFTLGQLKFVDSFQFMPNSLDTLVNNLRQDGLNAFPHILSEFPSHEHAKLLTRKGVYPYDYVDCFERFNEHHLPSIENFYSTISQEHITQDDYMHAQNVFQKFNMSSLGDYHDLYLKTDILLLADVFESFRHMCMRDYGLDACHFVTSPGLSWSSLLKMTKVELELITDIDQLLMIEAGIRGGVSQISKRYDKANNPYLDDFDPTKPTRYLQYLDANNLYGWAMNEPLPTHGFRWLSDTEIKQLDITTVSADAEKGYILQVSLHYPSSLHDHHNCLPLAPEPRHIDNDQLSPYAQQVLRQLHGLSENDPLPSRGNVKKLLTTFYDKEFYVLHYRNLQLYLRLGMELKAIHKVIEFRQSPWMRPYIQFNTQKRKEAMSTFAKGLYKLLNVAVFGKTMENLRKHRNIELVHREDRLVKLSAKPTYKITTIFNEDLAAVELLRSKVKLNKPSYSGMCILDLSKMLMYEFWYDYIKSKYPEAELLMTDTDSFLFACNTDDIYEDMKCAMEMFDTSDYPKDHPLYSEHNKKALGIFKDETCGRPLFEYVGLRSKLYSFLCDEKEEKRAKGIAKVTVRKHLRHKHYKETLYGETKKTSSMSVLRSHGHELFCETIQKTSLSAFDDKRFLLSATESVPYGSYKIYANKDDVDVDIGADMYTSEDENEVFTLADGHTYETVKKRCFFVGGVKVTPCVKQ